MRRLLWGAAFIAPFGIFAACGGDGDAPPGTAPDGGGRSSEAATALPDSGEPGVDGAAETDAGGDAASEDGGSDASTCTPPATPPVLVFLNRGGGTYTADFDDSRTNKTSLVSSTTTVTAWGVSDPSWQALVACVEKKFAPFNVAVTDTDPGNQEHIEVVFVQASLPALSGQPAIAPFKCAVVPNAVAFVSQAYAEANVTNGCAVAAQNVA